MQLPWPPPIPSIHHAAPPPPPPMDLQMCRCWSTCMCTPQRPLTTPATPSPHHHLLCQPSPPGPPNTSPLDTHRWLSVLRIATRSIQSMPRSDSAPSGYRSSCTALYRRSTIWPCLPLPLPVAGGRALGGRWPVVGGDPPALLRRNMPSHADWVAGFCRSWIALLAGARSSIVSRCSTPVHPVHRLLCVCLSVCAPG